MEKFKVVLGGKEVQIENTIPNSQKAAQHQIDLTKKAPKVPDANTAKDQDWDKYNKAINQRQLDIIPESVKFLSDISGMTESEINDCAQWSEVNEAVYKANCMLLDWDYKTRAQREKEANESSESDLKSK